MLCRPRDDATDVDLEHVLNESFSAAGGHASMHVDTELATTAVWITATNPLYVWRLDDVAVRAVAACMVAELTQAATATW